MAIQVRDIMSKPALTIDANKTARDAGKIMSGKRRGFLVVTQRSKPIGVVSDSDLIKKIIVKNYKASQLKIRKIMSGPTVIVEPGDDVLVAVRKMKTNNIHRLPVVDHGKVVGVITLGDIARTAPEMLDLLEYRLKMKEMPIEIKEKTTSGICEVCGNYSEYLKNISSQWVCDDCREEEESEE